MAKKRRKQLSEEDALAIVLKDHPEWRKQWDDGTLPDEIIGEDGRLESAESGRQLTLSRLSGPCLNGCVFGVSHAQLSFGTRLGNSPPLTRHHRGRHPQQQHSCRRFRHRGRCCC